MYTGATGEEGGEGGLGAKVVRGLAEPLKVAAYLKWELFNLRIFGIISF